MITKQINIDISYSTEPIVETVQRGDNLSRQMDINLFNHGEVYTIPPDASILLQWDKPDGTTILENTDGDLICVKDNIIHILLSNQMTVAEGIVKAKLSIVHNSTTLFSTLFKVKVEGGLVSEDKIVSSDEYNALVDSMEKSKNATENCIEVTEDFVQKLESHHFVLTEDKGIANGVAELNEVAKVPTEQLTIGSSDALGIVQSGANINNVNGILSVNDGTTTEKGVVQLTDSINSESTTTAATPNSVKQAYDKASDAQSDIDENRNNWNDKYTKNEVDNKFSTLETNIDWKESVDTYDDIATVYPEPQDGWTVNVKDTDYTYRYNGNEWVAISANAIPKATEFLDGLMNKESYSKLAAIEENANNYTHPDSTVVPGSYGNTSNQLSQNDNQFSIPYFDVDQKGHVTNAGTHTVTFPDVASSKIEEMTYTEWQGLSSEQRAEISDVIVTDYPDATTVLELSERIGNTSELTTESKNVVGAVNELETNINAQNVNLQGKQPTITGGATTITSSNLTANRALISNGNGKVSVSAVTNTELEYLDGVTSNIQTQLNKKQDAATAITTSNIGNQSVTYAVNSGYANSAGSAEPKKWTKLLEKKDIGTYTVSDMSGMTDIIISYGYYNQTQDSIFIPFTHFSRGEQCLLYDRLNNQSSTMKFVSNTKIQIITNSNNDWYIRVWGR